jgi:hypothetical protein
LILTYFTKQKPSYKTFRLRALASFCPPEKIYNWVFKILFFIL